jgi:hypothetical protein
VGLALAAGFLAPAPAHADPLPTRNQGALVVPYGLPGVLPARLPAKGGGSASLVMNWANTYETDDSGDRAYTMDAETMEWRVIGEYGLTDRFALRAELPWRKLDGGSLDGFIESWHSTFGLPNGGRDDAPEDRLLIQYTEGAVTQLQIDRDGSGLADIPLAVGYQVSASEKTAVSAWLSVKLPTGDAQDLTGSGSTDVALSVAAQTQLAERWQLFGQFDLAWLGEGDVLPQMQEDYAWSALAGVTWNPWRALDLTVQFSGNSKIFSDTGTTLDGDAVVLGFGGSWRTAGGWKFDLGFDEDVQVGASPDFVINLAAQRRF